jgi:hypothetical protein
MRHRGRAEISATRANHEQTFADINALSFDRRSTAVTAPGVDSHSDVSGIPA